MNSSRKKLLVAVSTRGVSNAEMGRCVWELSCVVCELNEDPQNPCSGGVLLEMKDLYGAVSSRRKRTKKNEEAITIDTTRQGKKMGTSSKTYSKIIRFPESGHSAAPMSHRSNFQCRHRQTT